VSEAGYRLYGKAELERLQHILFYRELDFPLDQIKEILDQGPGRISVLSEQKALLSARVRRLERLIQTIDDSIGHADKGEEMAAADMFRGFATEQEWREALAEQNRHLQAEYGYDMLEESPIVPAEMNEMAAEAKRFTEAMAAALKNGVGADDSAVQSLIDGHIAFLQQHGHDTTKTSFAAVTRFFLSDAFHRGMLEEHQTGLAYYLCIAAEAYASR
jgi:DNA-binding transcriptional MerR regulator